MKIINTIVPINLSMCQIRSYDAATSCHICEEPFLGEDDDKGWKVIMALSKRYSLIKFTQVRDHCHFTGKFRGAAHSSCNLKMRTVKKIPVFFHNLAGIFYFYKI